MQLLTRYRLEAVQQRLDTLQPDLMGLYPHAFPKAESRWISHYQPAFPTLRIEPDGFVHGGYRRLVASLLDLSWIRRAVAPYYDSRGGQRVGSCECGVRRKMGLFRIPHSVFRTAFAATTR